jgi:phenylpropionate dioxygenase-like ring-hydroxylating dioxygenase large terminal subunit
MDRSTHTDCGIFEQEARNVIFPHWQCAQHESSISAIRQFLNVDLCGELVLAVEGRDSSVRGLDENGTVLAI